MNSDRVTHNALILAPHGRDAAVAAALLDEAGIESRICANLAAFEQALGNDVYFAVVMEEALMGADLRGVVAWVRRQPSWSDLPFILLTQRGGGPERNPGAARLSDALGNVSFLERPFHPTTFVSLARTALRGRQRQFEARARIDELHQSEERLETALLAGSLGSWEWDARTEALTSSATCKSVFGRGRDAAFDFSDLMASIHADQRAAMQDAIRHALAAGEDFALEVRTVWPDSSVHWAEVRARPVREQEGRRVRLIGVCSDITSRKAAEAELRQLNEALEQRVAARTAELEQAHRAVLEEIAQRQHAEDQLRQAQKMEMLGQLTGGVAHDFNNLLMAVLGNLDVLRKRLADDAKATRLIDGALQGAQRGAALTQRLLAFARRQDLQVQPIDLAALVRGMGNLLERSVGSSVDLRIELPEGLPSALADANQIELALLNLVVNARDAMPDGGKLLIRVEEATTTGGDDLRAGRYLRLSVSDTGHGMDEETIKKAIEPFFSTKELGKGTGLGLSMIHGLAVQLGGALRLMSQPGGGTTAELWLPASYATARAEAPADTAELLQNAPRMTILVVDDDPLIAMSTADMLEDLGHEVVEANSGEKALKILSNGRNIDLMITDYSMPKMTGAQLAVATRAMHPGLPILLATGYADLPQGAEIDLPRLGKPYGQDQLAAEIAKVLASSGKQPRGLTDREVSKNPAQG